jgi:hypothetical protein
MRRGAEDQEGQYRDHDRDQNRHFDVPAVATPTSHGAWRVTPLPTLRVGCRGWPLAHGWDEIAVLERHPQPRLLNRDAQAVFDAIVAGHHDSIDRWNQVMARETSRRTTRTSTARLLARTRRSHRWCCAIARPKNSLSVEPTTVQEDVPRLKSNVEAAWSSRGSTKSYLRILNQSQQVELVPPLLSFREA